MDERIFMFLSAVERPGGAGVRAQATAHLLGMAPPPRARLIGEIYRDFLQLTRDGGFADFLVGYLPDRQGSGASEVLMTSHPAHVIRELDEAELDRECPLYLRMQDSTLPFEWGYGEPAAMPADGSVLVIREESGSVSALMEFLQRNTIVSGLTIPLHSPRGRRAHLTLTSPRPRQATPLAPIVLGAITLFDALIASQPAEADPRARAGLTDREVECLRWVAAGKTSNEIAQITELSEHTINHYLTICCRKLDSVNRIQAVAKAIRLGVI